MLQSIRNQATTHSRWLMLIPLCFSGLWFTVLEKVILVPRFYMYTGLDSYIPFLPVFVVPYVLWYFYVAGTALFLFFRSQEDFFRNACFIAGGMMIACLIYTLFPNGQLLRPLNLGDGVFSRMLAYLYSIDSNCNSAPSVHVIYSVAANSAILRYNAKHRKSKVIATMSVLLAAFASISTVFVKQHSILDVLGGLGVAAVLHCVIYTLPDMRGKMYFHNRLHDASAAKAGPAMRPILLAPDPTEGKKSAG